MDKVWNINFKNKGWLSVMNGRFRFKYLPTNHNMSFEKKKQKRSIKNNLKIRYSVANFSNAFNVMVLQACGAI